LNVMMETIRITLFILLIALIVNHVIINKGVFLLVSVNLTMRGQNHKLIYAQENFLYDRVKRGQLCLNYYFRGTEVFV